MSALHNCDGFVRQTGRFSALVRIAAFALIGFLCLAPGKPARTRSVTLGWDVEAEAAYYNLYELNPNSTVLNVYQTASTQFQVTGLAARTSYVFAVTAVTSEGLESEFSNEVQYTTGK